MDLSDSSSKHLQKLILNITILTTSFLGINLPEKVEAKTSNSILQLQSAMISTVSMNPESQRLSLMGDYTLDDNDELIYLGNNALSELPAIKAKKRRVVSTATRSVSAYNAGDINQCDGNPCKAANGENICTALDKGYKRCAANFVKFGTILEIEGYGECMVVDRMASRFSQSVDIAFPYDQKQEALKFGRRTLEVKIIEYSE